VPRARARRLPHTFREPRQSRRAARARRLRGMHGAACSHSGKSVLGGERRAHGLTPVSTEARAQETLYCRLRSRAGKASALRCSTPSAMKAANGECEVLAGARTPTEPLVVTVASRRQAPIAGSNGVQRWRLRRVRVVGLRTALHTASRAYLDVLSGHLRRLGACGDDPPRRAFPREEQVIGSLAVTARGRSHVGVWRRQGCSERGARIGSTCAPMRRRESGNPSAIEELLSWQRSCATRGSRQYLASRGHTGL
jgi:hypothetical protein